MRVIKDFIYDKNDIIIVLIIIALAAFIIYTRVEAIMAYPETLAAEAAATQQENNNGTASNNESTANSGEAASENNTTVHITIDDKDTSISVSEKLAEAGLVSSATEFEGYINNSGKDGSIKSGTFQIPSGSTDEEILNIITQ